MDVHGVVKSYNLVFSQTPASTDCRLGLNPNQMFKSGLLTKQKRDNIYYFMTQIIYFLCVMH